MRETLTAGDRGRAVRELNEGLRALGYEAGRGDRFTQATARGLFALQTDRGLEPTGVGDSRTRSLLSLLACNDPGEAFYGDADGDGQLTVKDMGIVLKSLFTGKTTPTVALDADGSGKVDLNDALYLIKCITGRAAPKPNAPWIDPEAGVGEDALKSVTEALADVAPLRRQLVEAALPFAFDPHGEHTAAFPKSLYLWGANLYGPDKELYCPTSATVELLAARKPAFFDGGRREMILSALQNAASLGDPLSGADCSGAIVGLWRKFGLVDGKFDAIANKLLTGTRQFVKLQRKEPVADMTAEERQCLIDYFAQLRPKRWQEWEHTYNPLTPAQYVFLILQDDLNYDDNTIAQILDVKPASLRTIKSRIKGRER